MKKKFPFPEPPEYIKFDEDTHRYYNVKYPDLPYMSVTTFLHRNKKFDAVAISESLAKNPNSKYYGSTAEEIRNIWDIIQKNGTRFHKRVEDWIESQGNDEIEIGNLFNKYEIPSAIFSNFNNIWSEVRLVFDDLLLAGTADIIYKNEHTGYYEIFDIKTSKTMNPDKILDYSYQIILYVVMLKKMGIKNVKPGGIFWIENNNIDSYEYLDLSDLEVHTLNVIDCRTALREILNERYSEVIELKKILNPL